MTLQDVVIRPLQNILEFKASEQFQRDVWGNDDPADNADLLQAISQAGGLVAAAYKHKQMVGFIFGFPTNDPQVQHSHRLAVHPKMQGQGLGTQLKWFQRNWCMQQGINTVRWTYDPIRCANAILNIDRLGAVANEYHENYYGDMAGINAGVPSDRIVAVWRLLSSRVVRCAESERQDPQDTGEQRAVSIPPDFTILLNDDMPAACAERLRVRAELNDAFDAGFVISGFDRQNCQYTLSRNP